MCRPISPDQILSDQEKIDRISRIHHEVGPVSEQTEPTKQRDGDQVIPTGDVSIPDDQALLIADIEKRRQVGIERYGQGHRPFNGRDTLLDAYEEQLDFLVYLRSLRRMKEASREELIEVVTRAFAGYDETWPGVPIHHQAEIAVDRIMGWVVAYLDKQPKPVPEQRVSGQTRSEDEKIGLVLQAFAQARPGETDHELAKRIAQEFQ